MAISSSSTASPTKQQSVANAPKAVARAQTVRVANRQQQKTYSEMQEDIIGAVPGNPVIAVQALAGTGKTSTGVGIAERYPNKRVLVLCFNTANAAEAEVRYPKGNTRVSTTHGMAWGTLDSRRRARVSNRWNTITIRSELPFFGHRADYAMAFLVMSVLRDFFQSADPKIDPSAHGVTAFQDRFASDSVIATATKIAEQFWAAMCTSDKTQDLRGSGNAITIPHDAYLKQFALEAQHWGYDIVIFDEAQDANPVTLGMLNTQARGGSHLVFLGDRNQSIYEFRGAVNAMERLPAGACVLPLTESWRFGPATAEWANLLLELKGEPLRVVGRGEDRDFDGNKPFTRLSRTNADLLQFAISQVGIDQCGGGARPGGLHWVGGVGNYKVGILKDVYNLRRGRVADIKDPYISRNFRSWSEYVEAAKYDQEAKILSELAEQYNDQIPRLVDQIIEREQPVEDLADYTVSTMHKSKGLEWPQVQVAGDFRDPIHSAEDWLAKHSSNPFPEQEINLMYVGATRAKHALLENEEMYRWRASIDTFRRNRVRDYDPSMHGVSAPAERPRRSSPGTIHMGKIKGLILR